MSNKHWCMPNYPTAGWYARSPKTAKFFSKDIPVKESLLNCVSYIKEQEIAGNLSKENADGVVSQIAIEYNLLCKETPSLFISSKPLARFLIDSTYSAGLAKQALSSSPIQWVCFPSMNYLGIDTRPFVIGKTFYDAVDNGCGGKFFYDYVFYLKITDQFSPFFAFDHERADDILQNKEHGIFRWNGELSNLTKRQHDTALFMVRAGLGALVYAAAFPDYICQGLPDDVKAPTLTKPRILTAAPEILEGATRTSVSMHIRAGHFKTLQHERFKRNEDGTAKVIFVRQTVVAGKLTPKTAVGL